MPVDIEGSAVDDKMPRWPADRKVWQIHLKLLTNLHYLKNKQTLYNPYSDIVRSTKHQVLIQKKYAEF